MHKLYKDYYWKEGIPAGIGQGGVRDGFRIISDPYHKRYTVERYEKGSFAEIVYDSFLFDFRFLKEEAQTAWTKEVLEESSSTAVCLIRNQDDRIIIREHHFFERGRCRRSEAYHPLGILVSTQNIFYKDFGDFFNGVILKDGKGKPVMKKEYEIDEKSGEFAALLSETRTLLPVS